MARLLIVSRSMALAMRLADQHEVSEHPADKVDSVDPGEETDVLVLDIGDPIRAVTTVNDLREAGYGVPVLLVSGYQPEWEQVEAQQVEGVRVVPLPITRAALLDGVSALLEEAPGLPTGQMDVVVPSGAAEPAVDAAPAVEADADDQADDDEADGTAPAGVTDQVEDGEVEEAEGQDAESRDAENPEAGTQDGEVEDAEVEAVEADAAAEPEPAEADPEEAELEEAELEEAELEEADEAQAGLTEPEGDEEAAGAVDAADTDVETDVEPEDEAAGTEEPDIAATDEVPEPADDELAAVFAAAAEELEGPDVVQESVVRQAVRIEPTVPPWEEVLAPSSRPTPRWGRFSRGTPDEARATFPQTPASGAISGLPTFQTNSQPNYGQPDTGGQTSSQTGSQNTVGNGNGAAGGPNTGGLGTASGPGTGALNTGPLNTSPLNTGPLNTGPLNTGPLNTGPLTGSLRRPGLPDRPRKFQRHPNFPSNNTPPGGSGLVTDPLGPRTDPRGFPSSGLDRRLDDEAGALMDAAVIRDANGVAWRTADLIQVLIDSASNLYGVSDTAQVLADDVIEKADADAAAVLVPDGPLWRVSGGVGLRPLERRLILDEHHWLISEIGTGGRAVLIEDTDIVRQQLSGAPLAAWRHLLAVPVPDVHAIVVLARGQEAGPFSDRDLSVVFAPVREAAPLLAQAVETRRLARLLGPLREQDPEVLRRTQSD